jgi:hypothetical protein
MVSQQTNRFDEAAQTQINAQPVVALIEPQHVPLLTHSTVHALITQRVTTSNRFVLAVTRVASVSPRRGFCLARRRALLT